MEHTVRCERGASMSMALMLFLVVTVVASIALTAATAVAGRYSQLADADRSYYNVTSAAQLFWDEMGRGSISAEDVVTVTVTRACNATDSGGGYAPIDGTWSLSIDDVVDLHETDAAVTLNKTNASLFQIVTADVLFGTRPLTPETTPRTYSCDVSANSAIATIDMAELSPIDADFTVAEYQPFKIEPSDTTSPIKTVDVTLKCREEGAFDFMFMEEGAAAGATPFRCTLTATMGISDSAPRITEIGEDTYRVEWETTVLWKAESLTTGGGTYA